MSDKNTEGGPFFRALANAALDIQQSLKATCFRKQESFSMLLLFDTEDEKRKAFMQLRHDLPVWSIGIEAPVKQELSAEIYGIKFYFETKPEGYYTT